MSSLSSKGKRPSRPNPGTSNVREKGDTMSTVKAIINKRSLLIFFLLAFAISWGGPTHRGWSRWVHRHHGATSRAGPAHVSGGARRNQLRGHPDDQPGFRKARPPGTARPPNQVAGERRVVPGGAVDRPALDPCGTPRALAVLTGLPPRPVRGGEQSFAGAGRHHGRADGGRLRRDRLDRLRGSSSEAAPTGCF